MIRHVVVGFLIIVTFLAVLGLFSVFMWSPANAAESCTLDTSSKNINLEVSLVGENGYLHPVDAVLIDDEKSEVVVLYPGENCGIHYSSNQVNNVIMRHNNGIIVKIDK